MSNKFTGSNSESLFNKSDVEFMKKACLLCDKSNCDVRTAVICVKNGKVIGEVHNEIFESEMKAKSKSGKPEREVALHAEAALMADCALKGISIRNAKVYCTRYPCVNCTRMLIKAGIKMIYYMSDLFATGNEAESLFKDHGIPVVQLKESLVWAK